MKQQAMSHNSAQTKGRLLVTGGSGFAAGSVIYQASGWDCHVISRGEALLDRPGLAWHSFDPLDTAALRACFESVRPDAVVHTAAIAAIDYCEAHPDEARRVNADLTRDIAAICAENGIKLVYTSTDTVFGGAKGMYTEGDAPEPLNIYAESKAAGEEAVAAAPCPAVIARVSLIMGLPVLGQGNSFLAAMLEKLEAGGKIGVPDNEYRTPVDVVTLGRALLELAGNDFTGIIHLAGNDRLNRCEMVKHIAAHLGYPEEQVFPNDPAAIPGRAERPVDASLDNRLARRLLTTPMRGVTDGLDLVLAAGRQRAAETAWEIPGEI
jgi:dTDP-4-dehydrorhamnose reductase